MATHEARVPLILQSDRNGAKIRCGPASIQAILYGVDNDRFQPPTSASTRLNDDVRENLKPDQETIWTIVKSKSAEVAALIGGTVGSSEAQQVCEPPENGEPARCWATHPEAMRRLIVDGLSTETLRLRGIAASQVQKIPEDETASAIIASIESGVGAAVLIEDRHWVVAYKAVERPGPDFDIFYRDPAETHRTVWTGVDELEAALIDIDPAKSGNQAIIVAVPAVALAGIAVPAVAPAVAVAGIAVPDEPIRSPASRRPVRDRLNEVAEFRHLEPQEFAAILGDSLPAVQDTAAKLGNVKPTIRRVRNERKPGASYYLLTFGSIAMVTLNAITLKPSVIALASEEGEKLPSVLLQRDALRDLLHGEVVDTGDGRITLDKARFTLEDELVWQRCDQSRSPFVPFYVLRQPREGREAHVDRLYIRSTDHQAFPSLTTTVRGV